MKFSYNADGFFQKKDPRSDRFLFLNNTYFGGKNDCAFREYLKTKSKDFDVDMIVIIGGFLDKSSTLDTALEQAGDVLGANGIPVSVHSCQSIGDICRNKEISPKDLKKRFAEYEFRLFTDGIFGKSNSIYATLRGGTSQSRLNECLNLPYDIVINGLPRAYDFRQSVDQVIINPGNSRKKHDHSWLIIDDYGDSSYRIHRYKWTLPSDDGLKRPVIE